VGGSQENFKIICHATETDILLTHCTNPRPFKGLDNLVRHSGMNMGILYGAGKAQAEIACHATPICTKIQPGHRLAPLKF